MTLWYLLTLWLCFWGFTGGWAAREIDSVCITAWDRFKFLAKLLITWPYVLYTGRYR